MDASLVLLGPCIGLPILIALIVSMILDALAKDWKGVRRLALITLVVVLAGLFWWLVILRSY